MTEPTVPESAPQDGYCEAREDRLHCEHWWDESGPCCACGFTGEHVEGNELPDPALSRESPAPSCPICGHARHPTNGELCIYFCPECAPRSVTESAAHNHRDHADGQPHEHGADGWSLTGYPQHRADPTADGAYWRLEAPAPPAEPVEEAQRDERMCIGCGMPAFKAAEFNDVCCDLWGNPMGDNGKHAFPPVEVEDEGARPPRLIVVMPDAKTWEYTRLAVPGFPVAYEVTIPNEVEAAIRKEATAALRENIAELNASRTRAFTREYESRTRAEAAEGELRERDEAVWRAAIRIGILVGRMRGRDDHDGRTGDPDAHSLSIQEGEQWLADMAHEVNERAARALTAESVTGEATDG